MTLDEINECIKSGRRIMIDYEYEISFEWFVYGPAILTYKKPQDRLNKIIIDDKIQGLLHQKILYEPLTAVSSLHDGTTILAIAEWIKDRYICPGLKGMTYAKCKFCGYNDVTNTCNNCGCETAIPEHERVADHTFYKLI